ncbi:MAG: hypothetical protein ABA06_03160 [Parcubacteria bacterium C7867-001]|nr:MAG: hypothetical protein ABA06_03160 [Parcubacteria bacterium C7867-001]
MAQSRALFLITYPKECVTDLFVIPVHKRMQGLSFEGKALAPCAIIVRPHDQRIIHIPDELLYREHRLSAKWFRRPERAMEVAATLARDPSMRREWGHDVRIALEYRFGDPTRIKRLA